MTLPCRLITLHLAHLTLTDADTFILVSSSYSGPPEADSQYSHTWKIRIRVGGLCLSEPVGDSPARQVVR